MIQISSGFALDKAELLSTVIEAVLYGFSLLMFVGTMWALLSRRSTCHVNYRIMIVACLLLLVSTTHFVIDIIRLVEGFILFRNLDTRGPAGYFSRVSQWTFVSRAYAFTVQILLGDGVILYRCYVVWQSKRIMVLPVLLWCGVGATGFGSAYTASRMKDLEVLETSLLAWVAAFWTFALTTNALTTLMLACRIWYIDRKVKCVHGPGQSYLRPILQITIDAGVIYSISLLVALICFLRKTNFQYAMVTPIVSITFYMVIIRVALASRSKNASIPLESTFSDVDNGRMRVHITTLTESKVDRRPYSIPEHAHEHDSHDDNSEEREDKVDRIGEVV